MNTYSGMRGIFELGFDGLTHDPKGRQLKLAVTYQLGC